MTVNNDKINEILDDTQKIRDAIDNLAQKLSPIPGFSEQHAMFLRMYADCGYIMKRIRARAEQLERESKK